jgi:hypothetical protein
MSSSCASSAFPVAYLDAVDPEAAQRARDVHRCGVLAAKSRAGQRKYFDIESAAAHLHCMLEALRHVGRS